MVLMVTDMIYPAATCQDGGGCLHEDLRVIFFNSGDHCASSVRRPLRSRKQLDDTALAGYLVRTTGPFGRAYYGRALPWWPSDLDAATAPTEGFRPRRHFQAVLWEMANDAAVICGVSRIAVCVITCCDWFDIFSLFCILFICVYMYHTIA